MVVSAPAQMKARRRLSIWPIAHWERQQAMLRWTGMAESVTLVSKTRPALVSNPDFQVGILAVWLLLVEFVGNLWLHRHSSLNLRSLGRILFLAYVFD